MSERKLYRKYIAKLEEIVLDAILRKRGGDRTIDSMSFDTPTEKQLVTPATSLHLGSGLRNAVPIIFFLFILATFSIFVFRFVHLQFTKGAEYRLRAERNRERSIPIVAERGQIFDIRGTQLTENVPTFSIALTPQYLPRTQQEREQLAARLAEFTNAETSEILEKIDKYGSYSYESIVIQEDIDYNTAIHILTQTSDLPGIHILRGSKRRYLLQATGDQQATSTTSTYSLSHILGYLGKMNEDELSKLRDQGYLTSDNIGKTGVEQYYEQFLRGVYGERTLEVDAYAREQSVLSEEAPRPGDHIELSIDLELQRVAEQALQSTLTELNKSRGSVVIIDVNTGEIRALVSLPGYDNNDFSGGIDTQTYSTYIQDEDRPLFNRSIAGTYPSGSTIKPIVAGAALQEGVITPRTTILSTGGVQVGDRFFPDWQAGGHGITTVRSSLAWSVNTFYYYIGGGHKNVPQIEPLGVEKLSFYLHGFGLGETLGVDLPSERPGFIPSKDWKEEAKNESWYIGDTYNLSIGQGDLLLTPLQLTAMTASIANGGTLYRPHVLHATINPLTNEKHEKEPEVVQIQPVSDDNLQTIRLGMRDCVLYGACRRLYTVPIDVAGKTGTAQWSTIHEPHAWFTSFAPFSNPEIAVTVLIEEGEEGSSAAVPVADTIYRWWAANR